VGSSWSPPRRTLGRRPRVPDWRGGAHSRRMSPTSSFRWVISVNSRRRRPNRHAKTGRFAFAVSVRDYFSHYAKYSPAPGITIGGGLRRRWHPLPLTRSRRREPITSSPGSVIPQDRPVFALLGFLSVVCSAPWSRLLSRPVGATVILSFPGRLFSSGRRFRACSTVGKHITQKAVARGCRGRSPRWPIRGLPRRALPVWCSPRRFRTQAAVWFLASRTLAGHALRRLDRSGGVTGLVLSVPWWGLATGDKATTWPRRSDERPLRRPDGRPASGCGHGSAGAAERPCGPLPPQALS